jgi:hypothetical protein
VRPDANTFKNPFREICWGHIKLGPVINQSELFGRISLSNRFLCVKDYGNTTYKGIRLRKSGFNGVSQIGTTIDISKGIQAQKGKKEIFIYSSLVCHLNNMRAFIPDSNWFTVIGNSIHQW